MPSGDNDQIKLGSSETLIKKNGRPSQAKVMGDH